MFSCNRFLLQLGKLFHIYIYVNFRESVVFLDYDAGEEFMKGIDITGPPALPKQFKVKRGGRGDIIVVSDESDESDNEMNKGMIGDGVRDDGDN